MAPGDPIDLFATWAMTDWAIQLKEIAVSLIQMYPLIYSDDADDSTYPPLHFKVKRDQVLGGTEGM